MKISFPKSLDRIVNAVHVDYVVHIGSMTLILNEKDNIYRVRGYGV